MKNVLLMTSILILTFSGACRSKPNCWILQPWRFDATPPRSQLESASGGLPESPAVVSSSLTWWSSWIGQRSYRTWCYPYCQLDPWKNHLMEQSRICRLLFSCIGPASFSTLSLSNFLFLFCFCFFFAQASTGHRWTKPIMSSTSKECQSPFLVDILIFMDCPLVLWGKREREASVRTLYQTENP